MQQRNDSMPENYDKNETETSEAEKGEAVEESFPASDPPSWTLGTEHRKESSDRRGQRKQMSNFLGGGKTEDTWKNGRKTKNSKIYKTRDGLEL